LAQHFERQQDPSVEILWALIMSLQVVGGAVNGQKEVWISVLLVHHGNEQFEVLNRAMQTLETPNLFMIFVFTSGIRLLMPVPACL